MSFNFEFTSRQEDAAKIISREHAPPCVITFINQALSAFPADALVSVKANGHLFNNDHQISNATIDVRELKVRGTP